MQVSGAASSVRQRWPLFAALASRRVAARSTRARLDAGSAARAGADRLLRPAPAWRRSICSSQQPAANQGRQLGGLVSDQLVASTAYQLEVRASTGLQDELVDGSGTTGWDESVVPSMHEERGA